MAVRKIKKPASATVLSFSETERRLVRNIIADLHSEVADVFDLTPLGQPLALSRAALQQLYACLPITSNQAIDPRRRRKLDAITRKIQDRLEAIAASANEESSHGTTIDSSTTNALFQFKITLLETNPPIWRRIQTVDCTLDDLHMLIQCAMGWTNSHLHHFDINKTFYGDPEMLDDPFGGTGAINSMITKLSEIVPKGNRKFRFLYEYDFGDSWQHEIAFEGCVPRVESMRYPCCIQGERACPPEDVGGVWGYEDFLNALTDPNHESHSEFLEWAGSFDPEAFDAAKASLAMRRVFSE